MLAGWPRYASGDPLLQARPQVCLGVNVSAQSAVDDIWSVSTFAHLVVGLAETAQLPRAGPKFVQHLRGLGYRVSINDFGAGYALGTAMAVRQVDVIKNQAPRHQGRGMNCAFSGCRSSIALRRKRRGIRPEEIDGSFLDGAERHALALQRVAGLAGRFAPCVVMEGVDCEADLRVAYDAGVNWVQGNYVGFPR